MKLLCSEMLKLLAKSIQGTLPAAFTGKLTINLNFHLGVLKSATVGYEEGHRFE